MVMNQAQERNVYLCQYLTLLNLKIGLWWICWKVIFYLFMATELFTIKVDSILNDHGSTHKIEENSQIFDLPEKSLVVLENFYELNKNFVQSKTWPEQTFHT